MTKNKIYRMNQLKSLRRLNAICMSFPPLLLILLVTILAQHAAASVNDVLGIGTSIEQLLGEGLNAIVPPHKKKQQQKEVPLPKRSPNLRRKTTGYEVHTIPTFEILLLFPLDEVSNINLHSIGKESQLVTTEHLTQCFAEKLQHFWGDSNGVHLVDLTYATHWHEEEEKSDGRSTRTEFTGQVAFGGRGGGGGTDGQTTTTLTDAEVRDVVSSAFSGLGLMQFKAAIQDPPDDGGPSLRLATDVTVRTDLDMIDGSTPSKSQSGDRSGAFVASANHPPNVETKNATEGKKEGFSKSDTITVFALGLTLCLLVSGLYVYSSRKYRASQRRSNRKRYRHSKAETDDVYPCSSLHEKRTKTCITDDMSSYSGSSSGSSSEDTTTVEGEESWLSFSSSEDEESCDSKEQVRLGIGTNQLSSPRRGMKYSSPERSSKQGPSPRRTRQASSLLGRRERPPRHIVSRSVQKRWVEEGASSSRKPEKPSERGTEVKSPRRHARRQPQHPSPFEVLYGAPLSNAATNSPSASSNDEANTENNNNNNGQSLPQIPTIRVSEPTDKIMGKTKRRKKAATAQDSPWFRTKVTRRSAPPTLGRIEEQILSEERIDLYGEQPAELAEPMTMTVVSGEESDIWVETDYQQRRIDSLQRPVVNRKIEEESNIWVETASQQRRIDEIQMLLDERNSSLQKEDVMAAPVSMFQQEDAEDDVEGEFCGIWVGTTSTPSKTATALPKSFSPGTVARDFASLFGEMDENPRQTTKEFSASSALVYKDFPRRDGTPCLIFEEEDDLKAATEPIGSAYSHQLNDLSATEESPLTLLTQQSSDSASSTTRPYILQDDDNVRWTFDGTLNNATDSSFPADGNSAAGAVVDESLQEEEEESFLDRLDRILRARERQYKERLRSYETDLMENERRRETRVEREKNDTHGRKSHNESPSMEHFEGDPTTTPLENNNDVHNDVPPMDVLEQYCPEGYSQEGHVEDKLLMNGEDFTDNDVHPLHACGENELNGVIDFESPRVPLTPSSPSDAATSVEDVAMTDGEDSLEKGVHLLASAENEVNEAVDAERPPFNLGSSC